jgi:hypothetical protein
MIDDRRLSFSLRFAQKVTAVFRIAVASCCAEAETFSLIALKLQPCGP